MRARSTLSVRIEKLLLCLLLLALPSCDILDPEDEEESVGLETLERVWTRTQSSNADNDGMKILIDVNAATLAYLPPTATDYSVGTTLWRDIRYDGDLSFSLEVQGSDGSYYPATLELSEDRTRATVSIASSGAGSDQTWQAYPEPSGDEMDRIEGSWTRTQSDSPSNDGMRMAIDGSEGTLTFVPSGAFGFDIDDILWRDIEPVSVVDYTLEVRGSDSNYYPAILERVGSGRLELYIVAFSGIQQTWEN